MRHLCTVLEPSLPTKDSSLNRNVDGSVVDDPRGKPQAMLNGSRILGFSNTRNFFAWYYPSMFFRGFLVFLLSLVWFTGLQPWGAFRDPDSFYHTKVTEIILHGSSAVGVQVLNVGPFHFLQNFPWLDLTLLGENFVDQHLLYHLLLTPFVALFGMFWGVQIATVLFAAFFVTFFYVLLKWLRVSHPEVWTFLLAVCMPFAFRLSLGKATPFAVGWFLLGIGLCLKGSSPSDLRSTPRMLRGGTTATAFLTGLGFALSHGGWIILLVAQILFFFGKGIAKWRLKTRDTRALSVFIREAMNLFFVSFVGIFVGLLLHPNREHLLSFLKVQVFGVAIASPSSITLGLEWLPLGPLDMVSNLGPILVAACVVLLGLLFAIRKPLELERACNVVGLGVLVAALFAFTLKNTRMIEYFVPVFVIWLAQLWSLVDHGMFYRVLREHVAVMFKPRQQKMFFGCLLVLFCALFIHDAREIYRGLHETARPFDRLASVVSALKREVKPDERVFHDRWDAFGELFALAPQFRYISGVDPSFLLATQPELAVAYEQTVFQPQTALIFPVPTMVAFFERTRACRLPFSRKLAGNEKMVVCK